MSMPGSFAETVKQQADIVRIIGDYVKLKKAGAQNHTGLCPFHQEKTPSFSVHATRQFYHCFGCHASGDVFNFIQKIENIGFPEAVRHVAERCGIPVPRQTPASPAEAKEAQLRGRLVELHERACTFFEEQLRRPEAAAARDYLKERGLSDETIARFRIGYAPESGFLLRDRLRGSADEEALRASGLLAWKEKTSAASASDAAAKSAGDMSGSASAAPAFYSRFRNRIMFPIANESGKIIAFTGRSLAKDEKAGPKYLNSPETAIYSKGRVLFNLDRAREAIKRLDYAILVEGQMDCISVYAAGMHNVIATSGTAFTEAQVRLLGRYTKNVLVNFDPDSAGAAATERSLALLVSEDFRIKVMTLEAGYDPDLYIRRKGRKAYEEAMRQAPDYFDYLIQRSRSLYRAQTAEGKVQAVNFLLPHLQRVNNRIRRDELVAEMAQKLGIDSALLRQELKHAVGTRAQSVKMDSAAAAGASAAEKILMRALSTPELRDVARAALEQDNSHTGAESEQILSELIAAEDPGELAALKLSEAERGRLAAALMEETEELTPALVQSALAALRRRQLERKQRGLQRQIAEAERKQDAAALKQLIQEKLNIDRALAG